MSAEMNLPSHFSSAMALMVLAVVYLFATSASAIDVEVRTLALTEATISEIEETVIPRGVLIFNTANPLDIRLGDGTRLGGWQLYNFAALTSPPSVYNTNINLNGHSLFMGSKYSLVEEGNGFFVRDGTNTVVRIFSDDGGAFDSFSSYAATPTQIVVIVNCRVGDPAPVLERTASITEPYWQAMSYEIVRISEDSVRLTIDTTELDSAYVRIAVVPPVSGADFAIPVSAPRYIVGTNSITDALVEEWSEAHAWGNHADAGYLDEEVDPNFSAWLGEDPFASYLTSETDPYFASSAAYGITTNAISAWNSAASWGNHADAGYLEEESDPNFSAWLGGSPLDDYVPISIVNSNYYVDMCPDDSRHTIIKVGGGYEVFFKEDDVSYNGTLLWRNENGVNRHFGPITVAANTTNNFIRPDGGTNTISFDANFNMIVSVDGVVSLCVATNGNVGIRRLSEVNYALTLNGAIKSSASITGSIIYDTSGGGSVDPSGISTMGGIILTNVPTDTNGLPSGRIYNSSGVLKVMP